MSYATTPDGRKLHYETRGDDGPCVLLLNGMSQSTASWMSQARKLGERYRVVRYDARGQGKSPLGDGSLSFEGHLEDIDALLDHLGEVQITLVGFSHGARLALGYAASRPWRVERFIMTSIGSADDALRRTMIRVWQEVLALGGVEAMAWCTIPDILGRKYLHAHEKQLHAMVRATTQRNTAECLDALLEAMKSFPPPEADAVRVACPSLLISSSEDRLVSPLAAVSLVQCIPGCEHIEIEGVGHTIPIEAPDAWREAVEAFIG